MIEKTCKQCSAVYQAERNSSVYCSTKCTGDGKRNGKNSNCTQCGAPVYVQPSREKRSEQIFCSRKCRTIYRNLSDKNPSYHRDISGENNPMFGRGMSGQNNPMYGKTGDQCHRWKGGIKKRKDGYILVYLHSHHSLTKGKPGYVLQHRLILEQHLGRELSETEVVHHINENPSDNRIENLAVMSQSEHAALHKSSCS